jgi:hypothetical protein
MTDLPPDPFSGGALGTAMVAMFDMYSSATQAGFNETQALQIVIGVMAAAMANAMPPAKND